MLTNNDCLIIISRYLDNPYELINYFFILDKENYKKNYNNIKNVIFRYKIFDKYKINIKNLKYNNCLKFKDIDFEELYYNILYKPNDLYFPNIYNYKSIKVIKNRIININNKNGNKALTTKYPFQKQTIKRKIYQLIEKNNYFEIKSQNTFYYEVQIDNINLNREYISIGFCNNNFCLVNFQVGEDKNSYGLNLNNGLIFHNGKAKNFFKDNLNIDNDVFGCGYVFNGEKYDIFYTRNGNLIDFAFKNIELSSFYPTIGINSNKNILVNFNYSYFLFDIENFENKYLNKKIEYKYEIFNHIQKENRKVRENFIQRNNIYNIIDNYLKKINFRVDNDYEVYELLLFNIYNIIKENINDSNLIKRFNNTIIPCSFLIFSNINLESKILIYERYKTLKDILFFIMIGIIFFKYLKFFI